MGCNSSNHTIYDYHPRLQKWRSQFETLGLTHKTITKFYRIFQMIDADRSGMIDLLELMIYLDITTTVFSDRVFGMFDEDRSGKIDFREFVLSTWNYCTLGMASLILFAFDLYDSDSNGSLSIAEVENMLKDIYGKNASKNYNSLTISTDLKKLSKQGDTMDIESFRKFCQFHQTALFPAFQMQRAIQKRILGQRFWVHQSERRVELSHGKYVPISQLLKIHINKKIYDDHIALTLDANDLSISIMTHDHPSHATATTTANSASTATVNATQQSRSRSSSHSFDTTPHRHNSSIHENVITILENSGTHHHRHNNAMVDRPHDTPFNPSQKLMDVPHSSSMSVKNGSNRTHRMSSDSMDMSSSKKMIPHVDSRDVTTSQGRRKSLSSVVPMDHFSKAGMLLSIASNSEDSDRGIVPRRRTFSSVEDLKDQDAKVGSSSNKSVGWMQSIRSILSASNHHMGSENQLEAKKESSHPPRLSSSTVSSSYSLSEKQEVASSSKGHHHHSLSHETNQDMDSPTQQQISLKAGGRTTRRSFDRPVLTKPSVTNVTDRRGRRRSFNPGDALTALKEEDDDEKDQHKKMIEQKFSKKNRPVKLTPLNLDKLPQQEDIIQEITNHRKPTEKRINKNANRRRSFG